MSDLPGLARPPSEQALIDATRVVIATQEAAEVDVVRFRTRPPAVVEGPPGSGDDSIMENVGCDPLLISAAVHTAAYNHTIGTQKSAKVKIANPWEDFHVYAMEWYADRIDIFVGGQKGIGDALFPHRCLVDYVRIYHQR